MATRWTAAKRSTSLTAFPPTASKSGIADEGKGFDPDDVPDPMAPENLERPCGRGLLLMRHYMTEVTYHPPGNRLSMSKVRADNPHRNGASH